MSCASRVANGSRHKHAVCAHTLYKYAHMHNDIYIYIVCYHGFAVAVATAVPRMLVCSTGTHVLFFYLLLILFNTPGAASSLSVIALSFSLHQWWNHSPAPLPPVDVAGPVTPSAAEFACTCSCPAPAPPVVIGQQNSSWYPVLVGVLVCTLCCWYQARSISTVQIVTEEWLAIQYGDAASHRGSEPIADRRAVHVRGLQRGGGTLA